MNREELTAIVAGIIFNCGAPLSAANKLRIEENLVVDSVDMAERIIAESAKTPEQRRDERAAREVAKKMEAAEKEKVDKEATAAMAAAQLAAMKQVAAMQNAANVPYLPYSAAGKDAGELAIEPKTTPIPRIADWFKF